MEDTNDSEYNWAIEYLQPQNVVKVVAKGLFSVDGHSKMIEDMVSQKFWKPGMNLLVDDRKVEFGKTTIDLVRKVSEDFGTFEKELGSGKTAILMDSLSDYTRGRQFELLTDDKVSTDLKIFMDEQEALNWVFS